MATVGILSVIAIPSYREYLTEAKMVESYSIVDAISKAETLFFIDNREYRYLYRNPVFPPGNDNNLTTFNDTADVRDLGSPFNANSMTHYMYHVYAGRNDESGAVVQINGGTYGRTQSSQISQWAAELSSSGVGADASCYPQIPARDFYKIGQTIPNYAWAVIIAVANFQDTNQVSDACTYTLMGMATENGAMTRTPMVSVRESYGTNAATSSSSSSDSGSSSEETGEESGDSRDEGASEEAGEDSKDEGGEETSGEESSGEESSGGDSRDGGDTR